MTIALLAAGSRGDVQPYVALGVALRARGHAVRVAAPVPFRDLVESHGLMFHPVGGDMEGLMGDPSVQEAMRASNPLAVIRSFRKLGALAFALQAGLAEACDDADAVVFHPGASIGHVAALRRGLPSILATPFPMTPTRAFPSLIFYTWPRLGGWANRLTHQIFERVMWRTSKGNIERFYRTSSDGLREPLRMPFPEHVTERHPTIVSCSPKVFPKPADWPDHVHLTGYWYLDPEPDWVPSSELEAFLNDGPPPVYIGFGSMRDPEGAEHTTEVILSAVDAIGRRAVLALGEDAASLIDLPDHVFALNEAPHAWLFPRMSAIVHHGGAGTTAAALRAGVPSVVIPHANDQPAWARRLEELGVAPEPIAKRRLDASELADRMTRAHRPERVAAAASLGAAIRSEAGVEAAADVIERARATQANGSHLTAHAEGAYPAP